MSKLFLTASILLAGAVVTSPLAAQTPPAPPKEGEDVGEVVDRFRQWQRDRDDQQDLKSFDEVSKGFEKVVSTIDGKPSLYAVYINRKKSQMLAELPRGWANQKHFIAVTQAGGGTFAGLQGPTRYVYWRRYGNRLALIQPEVGTRSTGEAESKSSVSRLFTDRVLIDMPIVATGPSGQPVIDLDELLVKNARTFAGATASGANTRLAEIVQAKAFPKNVELAIEMPVSGGRLISLHYSISVIPDKTGYTPRVADGRVGYFTTVYRDLGKYRQDEKWVRYIDRWHLEKRDPKLSLSPPKEPIVFYLEHTIPVRYRRWVRQGILYWNEAFRGVGLDSAVEVYIQDASSGAHMDKDPEDVRYNFVRWLNNDISTAIGPHRSHPLTGQILDADIVLTDGWIRSYWGWYNEQMPHLAIQSFSPDTLDWLEEYPEWDPRIQLVDPADRAFLIQQRRAQGHADLADAPNDPVLSEDASYSALRDWLGEDEHMCLAAYGLAFDMAAAQLIFQAGDAFRPEEPDGDTPGDQLDGIPEWFVGPMVAELTCHEVGHTLGLRHNFKASSIHSLDEINSEAWKGKRTMAGSVMDYLPANFNMGAGDIQGDFTMIGVGPYDKWAIEYGYTFGDTDKVLERVAEPELAYLTDDDTGGPDPYARRYDFSADPLGYAAEQMKLALHHRERILSDFVKDGESWSKARHGYNITLGLQTRALSMSANWIGGAHVNRDHKGDPNGRPPIEVVDPEQQRRALQFVIDNAFRDEAFGLTPDLMVHMTVDKWGDAGTRDRGDSTWPVHDRVMGVQASSLTMILNPKTLARVHDNELRTPGDDDALTLPEVIDAVAAAVFTEISSPNAGVYSDRQPMISSLRRNLQSVTADRMVSLAGGVSRMPAPVRTLALQQLRELDDELAALLADDSDVEMDRYTRAHVADLHDRVTRALNTVYVNQM